MARLSAAFLMVLITAALLFSASEAEARRLRLPFSLLIPRGTSVDGTLIKVQPLPSSFEFKGQHFDLGYYWPRNGNPGWVGYLSSSDYVSWPDGTMETMLDQEGVTFPPVPDRPATNPSTVSGGGWGSYVVILIFLLGIGAIRSGFMALLRMLFGAATGAVRSATAVSAPTVDTQWQQRAEQRMKAAATARGTATQRPVTRSTQSRGLASNTTGQVGGFGRR